MGPHHGVPRTNGAVPTSVHVFELGYAVKTCGPVGAESGDRTVGTVFDVTCEFGTGDAVKTWIESGDSTVDTVFMT